MLYPSTQDPAGFAAAPRAAEAEALSAAGTFGAALRASPEFGALLAYHAALNDYRIGVRVCHGREYRFQRIRRPGHDRLHLQANAACGITHLC